MSGGFFGVFGRGGKKKKKDEPTLPIIDVEPEPTPAPESEPIPEPPVVPPVVPEPVPPVVPAPLPEPPPPVVPPVTPIPTPVPPTPVPTPPKRPFALLDATRFPGNPPKEGMERVRFVYASEINGPDPSKPDAAAIRSLCTKLKRETGLAKYGIQLDKEDWSLDVDSPNPSRHVELVRLIKTEMEGKVSFYGELPIRDATSMNKGPADIAKFMEQWRAQNNSLKPLADAVDALYPSLYPLYTSMVKWGRFATEMIKEAKRISGGKPVYGVVWIDWHQNAGKELIGVRLPYDVILEMYRTIYEAGADGICVWSMAKGSKPYDPNEDWVKALAQFRKEKGL